MDAGLEPETFWLQTPRTLTLIFKGVAAREERQHHDAAWAVWHSAALVRVKKLPKLDTLVGKATKARSKTGVRKTPEELAAIAEKWIDRLGG